MTFDPEAKADQLSQTLEFKAELLLSAQGHYLRAIKVGNGYWATAAGERIGSLYEVLHKQMMESPAPKELTAEEGEVYRQEVRRRIRILLTKAIGVYESTVATAERIGSSGPLRGARARQPGADEAAPPRRGGPDAPTSPRATRLLPTRRRHGPRGASAP